MVDDRDLVETMGLVHGERKLGGALRCSDFGEGFACNDIRVEKRSSWRYGLRE